MTKDGPFVLFEVGRLTHRVNKHGMDWFDIRFRERVSLAASSRYHAFIVMRDGAEISVPARLLKMGDKVWVDTSAFGADRSLHQTRK